MIQIHIAFVTKSLLLVLDNYRSDAIFYPIEKLAVGFTKNIIINF